MMRRAVFLTLLLFAPTALANNTGKTVTLRVTLDDGRAKNGKVKFRKSKLDAQGLGKVPYGKVAELAETLPHTEERATELRAEFAKRAGNLADDDGKGWARLGKWAAKRELVPEARQAFETAVRLVPEDSDVRRGLGEMKVDGAWVNTAREIANRRAKLKPKDLTGHMNLAKLATKNGAHRPAFGLLEVVLGKDSSNKRALKMLRPLTDRMRHKTKLSMPVAGVWKASEDKTRHHQKNVSAIYALDLVRVDEEGRQFTGRGKALRDYLAYGEPVYAAADGKVVWVQTDYPDLPAGTLGQRNHNNGVGLDHGNGEVSWYMHFQPKTCTLKMGDTVKRGQVIGKVGNSGKSNIPHLHFALAWRGFLGLPWRVDELTLIAEDGTEVPARRICPREGWTFKVPAPKPEPEPEPGPGD